MTSCARSADEGGTFQRRFFKRGAPGRPMGSPPQHVLSALQGQRPDFLVPVGPPQGLPPKIRLLAGAATIVIGLGMAGFIAFGNATVSTDGGPPSPMSDLERLGLVAAVLVFGALPGVYFIFTGVRGLQEQEGWLAGTPEGILVITEKGTRLEPWTGFSEARRQGDDLHLVPRLGFRDPGGRNVHAPGEADRIQRACLARMRGGTP